MLKSDVVRVGSPAKLEIEGLLHLMYHGTSLDSMIAGLAGLSYERPEEAMLELVKRRHLSPIYGDNLIVPESRDYLVIDQEPDVVHMGHVHKNGYMVYRGTRLLNSGTFQDRTDFQVRMGHVPTPGIVPVLEAKTGRMHNIGFKAV
jgi:DNA polymerase II small subunit